MGAFKVRKSHGAGAVCRVAFMSFDNGGGAEESSIWILWGIAVGAMLVVFFQDEFDGKHEASAFLLRPNKQQLVGTSRSSGEETRIRSSERSLNSSELDDDDSSNDLSSDDEENDEPSNGFVSILGLHSSKERPQDTLDMRLTF
eukprot:scaffold486545_cov51-Attheya_sp.AAC.1